MDTQKIHKKMHTTELSDDPRVTDTYKALKNTPYRDDTPNERAIEEVCRAITGMPCVCRVQDIGIFHAEMALIDGTMYAIVPESYADADTYVVRLVAGELFKATQGDATAQPSKYVHAMYHAYADSMHDAPSLTRRPKLDDAMDALIATGEVPDYAHAFVKRMDPPTIPVQHACSCIVSERLIDRIERNTATDEEEVRCLSMMLANVMGRVIGGEIGGFDLAKQIQDALGITFEEVLHFAPLFSRNWQD